MTKKFFARFCILAMGILSLFSQELYDINNITTVELTFSSSNWDYQLDQLYAAGDEERLMATAVINGVQFDSVGVRYKGNSSYSSNNRKNPLNIKLDYMISDQEYDDFGTLKLSNVYKDPSFVREVLAYEIARNYMPAPLSNYAKVTINGEYIGLYSSNQDVDKYFALMHFGSKDNVCFKGELTNDSPMNRVTIWGYHGVWSSSYTSYYELESDEGWNDLINFLDVYNNDSDNMEDVLNVDNHLWMLAFDNLLVNLDSPINFGHNYYLFEDQSGRFNPIIWDMNENFGGFSQDLTGSTFSTTGMQQMSPYFHVSSSYYPIIEKVLSNDSYKKMYIAHMKTIINDYFADETFRNRALEIQDIIDTEVYNDPNKFYTYANFTSNVDNSVSSSSGGRPGPSSSIVGLTQLMDARAAYLLSHSDFTPTAPEFSNMLTPEGELSIGDELTFSIEAGTVNNVYLYYRLSSADAFAKIEMLDDGNHGDGTAGDGVYGTTLTANSSKVEYYFYAENDNAASFLPERAAYEFYELSLEGNLVINEFMADNESTLADANGDYDDWIEIYNNTSNTIDLNGFYLSDDYDDLTKWAFPDVSIEPYSYLLIWADKDEDESEVHASFKLSASGEAIYLVNASQEIIDEVIFASQDADASTGRYENGVGAFIQMSPTPLTENTNAGVSISDDSGVPQEFSLEPNYPNPFNPITTLDFTIVEAGDISLKVYDAAGRLVDTLIASEQCTAGHYSRQWNAQSFPSGVYIAVLQSGMQRQSQKMILMK